MKVVFRKFKEGKDIIALFPEEKWSKNYVTSFMHIGQHSEADYDYVMRISVPAKEVEYKPLLDELINQVGYNDLKIAKRK